VATTLLRHPLVSGATASITGLFGGPRLGTVVHREEFTKLLMVLATDHSSATLDVRAKEALTKALTANGVENPAEALKNIRQMAMQLERSAPELSHMARQNLAILHAAESDLVAKINNWFDQTMDRTSQRFTASTRVITFVGAFIIAFALQVDTPAIVNRLAADDALRDQLVKEAGEVYDRQQKQFDDATLQADTTADAKLNAENRLVAEKQRAMLSAAGLIRLPTSGDWTNGYNDMNAVLGMLITALLLSLGAPFWYGVLGKLLQLRSVLAVKDDKQRAERQMNESAAATPAGLPSVAAPQTAAASLLAGERGDMTAIG
jgi:hypothetical protein